MKAEVLSTQSLGSFKFVHTLLFVVASDDVSRFRENNLRTGKASFGLDLGKFSTITSNRRRMKLLETFIDAPSLCLTLEFKFKCS